MRALLLENIHPLAVERYEAAGYEVVTRKGALDEDELIEALDGVSLVGIRSKTHITDRVLASPQAQTLEGIGAYCIGTNQIDLGAAASRGIPVFNAPYSNTRSVVEIAVAEIIALTRHLTERDRAMHEGVWDKSATDSHEIRGHTLGIVGYGNIGTQLSVIAEALGMHVVFYDVAEKLALGNAVKMETLGDLLKVSDVVTLHVDGRPGNAGFFGAAEFAQMQPGSKFMNLCRGFVVDYEALRAAIAMGHITGAAVDVYPVEPKARGDHFESELQKLPNVILTPHIGGSTLEAQHNIAEFVTGKLLDYLAYGVAELSVNIPGLRLNHILPGQRRIGLIHRNVPGVLAKLNNALDGLGVNITSQILGTWGQYGYVSTDVDGNVDSSTFEALEALPETIRVRLME